MHGRLIGIVIAALTGAALFGIFKSLEFFKENARLSHSVAFLTSELEGARTEFNEAKSQLTESRMVIAQLEDDAQALKNKLVKSSSRIAQFEAYTDLLRKKYAASLEIAHRLDENNRQLNDRLLRVNLENQEYRMKLSSEKGLREALRELKKPPVKTVKTKRGKVQKKGYLTLPSGTTSANRSEALPSAGNQGFLLKDGRSTIEKLVDIRVEAVSVGAEAEEKGH